MQITTLKQARQIAGSLGHPSKMPGLSYGISAHNCITGSKLHHISGSVCEGCYALERNNYAYDSVKRAHELREKNLATDAWIKAIIFQIAHSQTKYFRWHDSGDLQSFDHLIAIVKIARALPKVKFWIPTRENAFIRKYKKLCGEFPDNLTVRVSGMMIDGMIPAGFDHVSMVSADGSVYGKECRAYTRDNKCGNCRACWNKNVYCVTYHKH